MTQLSAPVLVVGAGPVGLILALSLAHHGIASILVERHLETTKWPKMDLTNARSMELLRRLNLTKGLREIGVPGNFSLDVHISTGLSDGGETVAEWKLLSPDQWRERIRNQNDGSMPLEPYQRMSQAVLEAWMKPIAQANPLIQSYFGLRFESLIETENGVESTLTDVNNAKKVVIQSKYVVGCDGAGSRVRKSMGSTLIGGPVPFTFNLVHFKSKDLSRIHKHGQFWHIFFTNSTVIISQDEVDTWTSHAPVPPGADPATIDPYEQIYQTLGGSGLPFPIKVDEILVTSTYNPRNVIANKYRSDHGRVFLAGDSAHQNIATGGYGMNTGLCDAFDLGWKLGSVIKGYASESLLMSYELERKPVGITNVEHSGAHILVHAAYFQWVAEAAGQAAAQGKADTNIIRSQNQDGKELRDRIKKHIESNDGENKDLGIELGYRVASNVIIPDKTAAPDWNPRDYIPSTWPGSRPPHIHLSDGKTSIYHLFGPEYTIVDFTTSGEIANLFAQEAKNFNLPLTAVHLPTESHAKQVWSCSAALIRPDDFVAWRVINDDKLTNSQVNKVLGTVLGFDDDANTEGEKRGRAKIQEMMNVVLEKGFTGTIGNVNIEERIQRGEGLGESEL